MSVGRSRQREYQVAISHWMGLEGGMDRNQADNTHGNGKHSKNTKSSML